MIVGTLLKIQNEKGEKDKMIRINKEETEAIRERFPDVCIVRTMKHDSKRHHYYVEEAPRVLRFLNRLRGLEEPTSFGARNDRKRGVRYQ